MTLTTLCLPQHGSVIPTLYQSEGFTGTLLLFIALGVGWGRGSAPVVIRQNVILVAFASGKGLQTKFE